MVNQKPIIIIAVDKTVQQMSHFKYLNEIGLLGKILAHWATKVFEGLLKSEMSGSAWVNLLGVSYFLHVLQDIWHVWWRIPMSPSGIHFTWKCHCSNFSLCLLKFLMMDWRRRFSDGWFPAKSKCRDCGLAAAQLLFELLTKRIPAASAIISQGLERWFSSTAMYYAKFFIVSDKIEVREKSRCNV